MRYLLLLYAQMTTIRETQVQNLWNSLQHETEANH